MTLVLDTSALLALAVDGPQRAVVLDALERDPIWCASAMALTEALPAIDRLTDESVLRSDLEDAIRLAWDHLHVVPLDQRCLDGAAALARAQPVRLSDAIHLAAAVTASRAGQLRDVRSRTDRRGDEHGLRDRLVVTVRVTRVSIDRPPGSGRYAHRRRTRLRAVHPS